MIYVDVNNGYRCHAEPAEGLLGVETDRFDGKCREYIEGYAYKPIGYELDGEYRDVIMVFPVVSHSDLENAQLLYEKRILEEQLADADAALERLGVV